MPKYKLTLDGVAPTQATEARRQFLSFIFGAMQADHTCACDEVWAGLGALLHMAYEQGRMEQAAEYAADAASLMQHIERGGPS